MQVYDKSVSIALTLDMNGVLKIGLDIIGADCMVNSLRIERETCVISSITDQVPFLEYEDLCNDVCKAFPDLASLINSIESALATTLAEDLKKDDDETVGVKPMNEQLRRIMKYQILWQAKSY